MKYGEDFHLSHKYATAALLALKEHELPASPAYFHLWYNFHSGRMPALRKAMQALTANGNAITADICDELCEQHLKMGGSSGETVLETSLKLEGTLGQIMQMLDNAGTDNARFGDTLSEATGNLERASSDPKELRQLIDNLVAETHNTLNQNRRLQKELATSSQEVNSLRIHLEEVRREAMTDGLTGIANRKFFDMQLREAISESMVQAAALSLVFMDIDHFKQFNDRHGHQLGDQVLRLVARCLTDCVKGRDTAARYGGEEFAVILPCTPLDAAMIVAEQIRKNVASKRIVRKRTDEDLGGITLSLGVAQFMPGESEQALVERADAALYLAKRSGRNQAASENDLDQPVAATA